MTSVSITIETAFQWDARVEIVGNVGDWSGDLIVLDRHGYTGIKRVLLVSVGLSVVSHAPPSD
jgi:hypothetical protein